MSTVRYPAMVFDLDGTLVDSVYQHVLAWREALEEAGIHLAVWRIHRRIGMSGGLLVNALLREVGRRVSPEEVTRMQQRHAAAYLRQFDQVRPLPGAPELLRALAGGGVPPAIATSSRSDSAGPALRLLGVGGQCPWSPGSRWNTPSRTRTCSLPPRRGAACPSTRQLSWGTVSGICWQPGGLAPWGWACSPVATARKNWSAPARIGSTRILRTCCGIWMSLAFDGRTLHWTRTIGEGRRSRGQRWLIHLS